MDRIASFCVDHTRLKKGLYVSRIDGDVVTYDIRMCLPNAGCYLENAAIHTIEHLFATYVRNTPYADRILYVGPMGCLTGFYFLTRDSILKAEVIRLLQDTFAFAATFQGAVPGSSEPECGNYRLHDLSGARKIAADIGEVLREWTPEMMSYDA